MEHRLGSHLVSIDGDMAILTLDGDCRAEHIRAITALLDGIGGGEGMFYVLADVLRLHGVQPEARRIAGEWRGIRRSGGTAIIGATVFTRTLILLASRASALLSKTKKQGELSFFNTEAEALTWLAAARSAAAR